MKNCRSVMKVMTLVSKANFAEGVPDNESKV